MAGLLCACAGNGEDGKATAPDFQPSTVTFGYESNSKTLRGTNGQDWWFAHFMVNDSLLNDDSELLHYEYREGTEHKPWNIVSVKGPWFTISKADQNTLVVNVSSATADRKVSFEAYRGNSWQTITVVQRKQ